MPKNTDTDTHNGDGVPEPESSLPNHDETSKARQRMANSQTTTDHPGHPGDAAAEPASAAPPPTGEGDRDRRESELRRLVREVAGDDASLELGSDAASGTQFALIGLGAREAEQLGNVRRALLTRFAEGGYDLLPLLMPTRAQAGQADSLSTADWLAFLGSNDQPQQLFAHLRKTGRYPVGARKLLVKTARDYAAIIDFLHGNVDMPCHAWLHAVEEMLRTLFGLLFAMYDQTFSADLSAIPLYNAKIMGYGAFNREDILAYFEIAALAKQAKLHYLLTGKELDHDANVERVELLQRALSVCHKLESLCQSTLLTPAEQRRQRTIKRIALASAVGLALVIGVWAYIATRPLQPISDTSVIRNPGGIVATYYNGKNFEHKVLQRWEARPFIWASGSPAPGVRADHWSVRWAGFLFFPESGTPTLCIDNDDGGRVFLAGKRIINDWRGGPMRRNCQRVRVKKGWYPVRMELYDDTSGAVFRVLRGKDKRGARVIPSAHFCCRTGQGVVRPFVRRPTRTRLVPPTLVRSIGGRGGARRHDYNCQRNSAISELQAGQLPKQALLSSLRPVCQILSRKGTQPQFLGFPRTGPIWGGPLRNPKKIACPSGKVLVGIYGRHAKFISAIGGLCADPFDRTATPTKTIAVGEKTGATFEIKCPTGSLLHGLFGRSGDLLDSVGIRCVAHRSLSILERKVQPTTAPVKKVAPPVTPTTQPETFRRKKRTKLRRKKRLKRVTP